VSRSQKHKKTDALNAFFAFLGSAHIKALSKMLMKLTLDVEKMNKVEDEEAFFLENFF